MKIIESGGKYFWCRFFWQGVFPLSSPMRFHFISIIILVRRFISLDDWQGQRGLNMFQSPRGGLLPNVIKGGWQEIVITQCIAHSVMAIEMVNGTFKRIFRNIHWKWIYAPIYIIWMATVKIILFKHFHIFIRNIHSKWKCAVPIYPTCLKLYKVYIFPFVCCWSKCFSLKSSEPLHYRLRPIKGGQFRFAKFAPHF